MVQINDMFFENLTPENTIKVTPQEDAHGLCWAAEDQLQLSRTPAPMPFTLTPTAVDGCALSLRTQLLDDLLAGNEVIVGPQNGLKHSEGPMGRTSLTSTPSGPYCRDLSALQS